MPTTSTKPNIQSFKECERVPQWTSGLFDSPSITIGSTPPALASGLLTIRFPDHNTANDTPPVCGRATVGQEGGFIELNYYNYLATTNPANGWCYVSGYPIPPITIRHEIGHALGLYHTDSPNDIMFGGPWDVGQKNHYPAPRELTHLRAMYDRPVGNLDPDIDPGLGTAAVHPTVIIVND